MAAQLAFNIMKKLKQEKPQCRQPKHIFTTFQSSKKELLMDKLTTLIDIQKSEWERARGKEHKIFNPLSSTHMGKCNSSYFLKKNMYFSYKTFGFQNIFTTVLLKCHKNSKKNFKLWSTNTAV